MKEQEQQCDLSTLRGEAVGIAATVALQHAVALEFSQIVAELVQAVSCIGEVEGGQDSLVDFPCRPAADLSAAVQENLEEANHARVMDLDARRADRANGHRQGDTLKKTKIPMDVEPLGLETREPVDDGQELLTDVIEMAQPLVEAEVIKVIGAKFVAQEYGELLILSKNRVLEVGAEDMVTMLDLIDDGEELASMSAT